MNQKECNQHCKRNVDRYPGAVLLFPSNRSEALVVRLVVIAAALRESRCGNERVAVGPQLQPDERDFLFAVVQRVPVVSEVAAHAVRLHVEMLVCGKPVHAVGYKVAIETNLDVSNCHLVPFFASR